MASMNDWIRGKTGRSAPVVQENPQKSISDAEMQAAHKLAAEKGLTVGEAMRQLSPPAAPVGNAGSGTGSPTPTLGTVAQRMNRAIRRATGHQN